MKTTRIKKGAYKVTTDKNTFIVVDRSNEYGKKWLMFNTDDYYNTNDNNVVCENFKTKKACIDYVISFNW